MKKLLGTLLIAVLIFVSFPPQAHAAQNVAVVRGTLPKELSGTADFTSSGFGTPTAAIIFFDNSNTTNNPEPNAIMSIGFWDGTNQRVSAFAANDNQGTTVTYRSSNDAFVGIVPADGAAGIKFSAENITDGIRITLGVGSSAVNRHATVILLNGVSASVGTFTPNGTQNGTATSGSLGFAPKLIFFSTIGNTVADTDGGATGLIGFGFAANTPTHRWLNWVASDAQASELNNILLSETRAIGQASANALQWSLEVTTFGSDTFTATTRDGASGGDVVFYLALGGTDLSYQSGTLDSRTTTGDTVTATTNPTDALILVQSTAANTSVATVLNGSGGFSIGLASGSNQYTHNNSGEDGADTSNDNSRSTANKIISADTSSGGTRTLFLEGTVALNSSDFTVTYSTVDATARKGFYVAFGDVAVASPAAPPRTKIEGGSVRIQGGSVQIR